MFGDQTTGARRGRTAVAALLGVLSIAVIAIAGVRIVHPESLSSGRAAVTRAADGEDDVTAAARKATLAFLDVDYRNMDQRVKAVLALATGGFKTHYSRTSAKLIAATLAGRSVASGSVRYIGVAKIGAGAAVVFVAADSTFSNLTMEKARQEGVQVDDQRYYRLRLTFSKVSGRWLVSDLRFVT